MRNAIRFLIPMLLFAAPVQAQWTMNGEGVCTATGAQTGPRVISDGVGGWITTWTDNRANTDVYVQRLNSMGTPLWAANGAVVCNATDIQSMPCVVSDGAGGAIVAWGDRRTGVYDIYAQRINSSGTTIWAANGVPICTATGAQTLPEITSDGAGGAIITWDDIRNGLSNSDIYAQRINSTGVVQWTADGVPVCSAPSFQGGATIVTDGVDGAIIAWGDQRDGYTLDTDIFAQRVNAAGVPQWTANGVAVCDLPTYQDAPLIVPDGFGGAIIAWRDERGIIDDDIYAQRINSTGVVQWTLDGVPIRSGFAWEPGNGSIETPKGMIADGSGGAIIAWQDWRSGITYDIYAQRVNGVGVVQWVSNGIAVCAALNNQVSPAIASDMAGGAVISWADGRSGAFDMYAQRLNSAGAPQWTPDGVVVCTAAGIQDYPGMISDGSGGAVVAWEDERSGASDIYAQRVSGIGIPWTFVVTSPGDDDTPDTLRGAILRANAVPGKQTITFNIPGAFPHTIGPLIALPVITDSLVIDGFTQAGSSANTNPVGQVSNANYQVMIEFPDYTEGSGLVFQAPGEVRGLAMNGGDATIEVASPNVTIKGCYVGTGFSGQTMGVNQQRYGIKITGNNCTVGGPAAADRVVVGFSSVAGIRVDGASNVKVQGAYVGATSNLLAAGMPVGVHLLNGASNARIGSGTVTTTPNLQEGNLIHYNANGVVVEGATSIGNEIVGNSLHNVTTSIDLGNNGPSPNDFQDRDAGPNRMENWPALSSAIGSSISGAMDGTVTTTIYLHFYMSPDCCLNAVDFIGATTVVISPITGGAFSYSLPGPIPPGVIINATATDVNGNTSETSQPVTYYNTGGGSNSTANLVDPNGAVYGTATFNNVTAMGNTYITHPYTPPVPVSGYAIGNPSDPQIYFNITTNASYTGGVDVCLNYNENNIPGPEANLVLLHYDGSMWVNVTTSRDLVNNKICGHVTSLSPFVIGAATTTGVGDAPAPSQFALHTNVPNPFNPVTTIHYDVPAGGADVNITVFDVAGRLVRTLVDERRAPGTWSVLWNGDDDRGARVASGVYFYRMRAGSFIETRKMVLLK